VDRSEIAGAFFWGLVLLLMTFPFYWRRRGLKRNRAGHCARCNGALPWENRFRVEGLLVCEACAHRTQRRIRIAIWSMVLLGLASILFGIWLAISLRSQRDPSWWLGFVVVAGCGVGLLGLTRFAVWRMSADNRQALATEQASYLVRLLGIDKIRSEKNRPFE